MDLMWKTLLALFLSVCRLKLSVSTVLDSIYWNTSNTKFVPGKGITLYPQIGDKMDIVCPRLRPGQSANTRMEYFRVHLVSQKQLESCSVAKGNVTLLNCDKPDQDVKFTFKFQEFSPNLWGLEFLKGEDYYVISTSNSTLEGLDNMEGGVCKTKSMKLVLRVGQSPSDTVSAKELPKSFDSDHQSTSSKDNDMLSKSEQDGKNGESMGVSGSEVALFTGVASGAFVLVVLIIVALVLLARRRRRKNSAQCSAPLALHPIPKRSNNNNGSERSDIIFPLRASDSYYCPHYEKVSGDYGHPVYIVQEMEPQNPANVYYKV
ncbi:ephrin-B2b [Clarias gariepinus]|uniref:ephrin-B2b n=1 Tax=Clarias gariepinus TaxID=13013 RepID=UPI00234D30D1|nr:ephrin-B2b [Clarias gariepinus]